MARKERSLAEYQQQRVDAQARKDALHAQEADLKRQQEDIASELRQTKRLEDMLYLQSSAAAMVLRDLGVKLAATKGPVYLSIVDPSADRYEDVELNLVWGLTRHGNEFDLDDGYDRYEEPNTAGIRAKSVDLVVQRDQQGEILGLVVKGSYSLYFNRRTQRDEVAVITPETSEDVMRRLIQAAIMKPNTIGATLGEFDSFVHKSDEELYQRLLSNRATVRL